MPIQDPGIIAAFEAGRRARFEREAQERARVEAEEDRQIRKMILQRELRDEKIKDALERRRLTRENISMLEGRSERELGPEDLEGGVLPAFSLPGTSAPAAPLRMREQMVPGVEELGIPGVPVRPKTREQSLAETLASTWAEKRMKELSSFTLAPGQDRWIPGAEPGSLDRIEGPPARSNLRPREVVHKGRRILANYDAQTGQYFDEQGTVLSGVQPLPRETTSPGLSKRDQVRDFREGLVAVIGEGQEPEGLDDLREQAEALGLTWGLEVSKARKAATDARLKTARTGQLLETVPRDVMGRPLEDPASARNRRMGVADQILRGDDPQAGQVATQAEVEALARMWSVSYAEAKRRVEADGKRVIERTPGESAESRARSLMSAIQFKKAKGEDFSAEMAELQKIRDQLAPGPRAIR